MVINYPDNILTAIKEALVKVFWTKSHLKELFKKCGVPTNLISAQDWDQAKWYVIDPILNTLNRNDKGLGILRRILSETLQYKDGNHLLRFQDGQRRKVEAENSLARLRELVREHDNDIEEEKLELNKKIEEVEKEKKQSSFFQKLEQLKSRFVEYFSKINKQERGYDFELFLYDLFDLFDLSPRGPFKIKGEQVDGAFILDNGDFVLEAKWQKEPVILKDLRDLDGNVASNLDNTLGLFIAINGFSVDGLARYQQAGRPRIICMDGADLMLVLDNQIGLCELLRRKKSIAAQLGNVFVQAREILKGRY